MKNGKALVFTVKSCTQDLGFEKRPNSKVKIRGLKQLVPTKRSCQNDYSCKESKLQSSPLKIYQQR